VAPHIQRRTGAVGIYRLNQLRWRISILGVILYNFTMSDQEIPIVIGIAGGSGSGKTTLSNWILERVGDDHIAYIPHDAYYKDLSHLSPQRRAKINFDHPDSLDTDLLIEHIQKLRHNQLINLPIYDFKNHTRTPETSDIEPKAVILVEGILIFAEPALRKILDVKIFVDTDSDLRFIRRLERDIKERGRTTDSVIHQYLATVRPMHLEFVEPSKRYADIIVPEGGLNAVAMEMVVARLESLLREIR
jgi:uridine kinase